jgi:prepilin-type N-terminal cleavage/methylation domain-containing protein
MNTALHRLQRSRRAFTLIEVMVVVAIMGLIMAFGVPTLYQMFNKSGFRKTISDLTDVCMVARRQAIMQGVTTEVVFHPHEGRWEVAGGSSETGTTGGLSRSAQIDENTAVELLFVNQINCLDVEEGRIRFFPNGTSDELTMVLRSDKGEQWGITLDITTGLVSVLNQDKLWELRNGKQ